MFFTSMKKGDTFKMLPVDCFQKKDDQKDLSSSVFGSWCERWEHKQDDFPKTIVDIAGFWASAEERRRCKILKTYDTFNDLKGS